MPLLFCRDLSFVGTAACLFVAVALERIASVVPPSQRRLGYGMLLLNVIVVIADLTLSPRVRQDVSLARTQEGPGDSWHNRRLDYMAYYLLVGFASHLPPNANTGETIPDSKDNVAVIFN